MKVSIITLGCKVNQYESESLAKILESEDIDVSFDIQNADAYVINTCAVTNEAERKSRGIIAKIRKMNQNAPIYVCGCSSQNDPDKFLKYPGVKAIWGTSAKDKIAQRLIEKQNDLKEISISRDISTTYEDIYLAHGNRTRTVIKIQDGCNNFCSYCLIPYLRGRERSRSIKSVLSEIKNQAKDSKEITFTGINLSAYGKDLYPQKSLKDIALLMKDFPNTRFKFSSLEQNIITEDLIKTLSTISNFAPHFHLSLQSGCDKTLKAMNRKYTSNEFYQKVQLIRKYFPLASITTDIIVGFPTETEEDFEECYDFAKKCNFAKIHIFPFSSRSGTLASKMKNVATDVKERINKLSALDKKMQNEYLNLCKNHIFEMIFESEKNNIDYYIGHTENYIKCYVKSDTKIPENTIKKVKIIEPYLDGALGIIESC